MTDRLDEIAHGVYPRRIEVLRCWARETAALRPEAFTPRSDVTLSFRRWLVRRSLDLGIGMLSATTFAGRAPDVVTAMVSLGAPLSFVREGRGGVVRGYRNLELLDDPTPHLESEESLRRLFADRPRLTDADREVYRATLGKMAGAREPQASAVASDDDLLRRVVALESDLRSISLKIDHLARGASSAPWDGDE